MARIHEYTISDTRKLVPEEKGYAAFETAGRRIGPLFNAAAGDVASEGKLAGRAIREAITPFRTRELLDKLTPHFAGAGSPSIHLKDAPKDRRGEGKVRRDLDEISQGAANISKALSAAITPHFEKIPTDREDIYGKNDITREVLGGSVGNADPFGGEYGDYPYPGTYEHYGGGDEATDPFGGEYGDYGGDYGGTGAPATAPDISTSVDISNTIYGQ